MNTIVNEKINNELARQNSPNHRRDWLFWQKNLFALCWMNIRRGGCKYKGGVNMQVNGYREKLSKSIFLVKDTPSQPENIFQLRLTVKQILSAIMLLMPHEREELWKMLPKLCVMLLGLDDTYA